MQPELKDQDRFLPIANISRIMKRALPQNAKLSKESKVAVQECLSEFISFVTSQACERCSKERRKTINGEDLISALEILGFDKYCEPMRLYLKKFRDYAKQTELLREKDEKDDSDDEQDDEDSENEDDEEEEKELTSPKKRPKKKKKESHLKSEDSKSED